MIMRTFLKLDEMPSAWLPSRKSDAMATHSLPTIAITEPPLYSIIDCQTMSIEVPKAFGMHKTDHVGRTLRGEEGGWKGG